MRLVSSFGRFWWDFVVGDEWRIAAVVAVVAVAGALAAVGAWTSGRLLAVAIGALLIALTSAVILSGGRRRKAAAHRRG